MTFIKRAAIKMLVLYSYLNSPVLGFTFFAIIKKIPKLKLREHNENPR